MVGGSRRGFRLRLNPDAGAVALVREGLRATGGYCPCKVLRNEDTRCVCRNTRETGECECGLYVAVPMDPTGDERRSGGR